MLSFHSFSYGSEFSFILGFAGFQEEKNYMFSIAMDNIMNKTKTCNVHSHKHNDLKKSVITGISTIFLPF